MYIYIYTFIFLNDFKYVQLHSYLGVPYGNQETLNMFTSGMKTQQEELNQGWGSVQ